LSFQSRIQVAGGEPAVSTRLIKGRRMAILTRKHTSVIDLETETITEIDFNKKTYSVIPFARWKKLLDDATSQSPRETSFKVSSHVPAASKKPSGIQPSPSTIDIAGASGSLNITIDTLVGVVPGYEQMRDFNDHLAAKLGYAFASGFAELALDTPKLIPSLDEALERLNQSRGAPLDSTIKIESPGAIAEATIHLSGFGGGAQEAAKFVPPEGFKKVDPTLPSLKNQPSTSQPLVR
jgi:hypothetical protein